MQLGSIVVGYQGAGIRLAGAMNVYAVALKGRHVPQISEASTFVWLELCLEQRDIVIYYHSKTHIVRRLSTSIENPLLNSYRIET